MRMDRLVLGGLALAGTAAMVLVSVLGFRGGSGGALARTGRDPALSGRGAWLLNPYCRNVPQPGFGRPSNLARSGLFEDVPYGYSVTLPAGITAYASADHPLQGFGIVLSWEPRVYLHVGAAYDVFYDMTAAGVHRRDVQGLRLHDKLLEDAAATDVLGGEAAERYHMQFQCPGDPQVYVHDDFIVMRNREIYRLELQTVPSRYGHDAQLLTDLQHSWRWLGAGAQAPAPATAADISENSRR
jgi:hypothetical protein